jgi:hypothetical protein
MTSLVLSQNKIDENSPIVQRGNLGFCPLDMSLLNLCGVPSLWLDPKEFATGSSKIVFDCNDINSKVQIEPYIKFYQKKLF